MSHTPGPWTILNDDTPWTEGDAEIAQEYGEPFGDTEILFSIMGGPVGDDHRIALCPFGPGDTAEDQNRQRANAALMAAAPDMKSALRLALATLGSKGGPTAAERDMAMASIRIALRKAEPVKTHS